MRVDLRNRELKRKPEPVRKPLRPYMAKASDCVVIGGNPAKDELVQTLKESGTRPAIHVVKISESRWREIPLECRKRMRFKR